MQAFYANAISVQVDFFFAVSVIVIEFDVKPSSAI